MRSHEALQRAINGQTVEHAKALGLATITLHKWQEPSTDYTDSGAYNPLDRIAAIIEKSLSLKHSPDDAFAPIYFLAERFELIAFPAPRVNKNLVEIHKEIAKVTKEFGDMLTISGARMSDGEVTARDAEAITKEARDLQRVLASFILSVEKESEKENRR